MKPVRMTLLTVLAVLALLATPASPTVGAQTDLPTPTQEGIPTPSEIEQPIETPTPAPPETPLPNPIETPVPIDPIDPPTDPISSTETISDTEHIYLPIIAGDKRDGQWKRYANEAYGFSFEYPSSWIPNEAVSLNSDPGVWNFALDLNSITNETENKQLVELYIWQNPEQLTLMDWASRYIERVSGASSYVPPHTNAQIRGREAFYYVIPGIHTDSQVCLLFEFGGNIYWLRYSATNGDAEYSAFLHLLRSIDLLGADRSTALPEIATFQPQREPSLSPEMSPMGESSCGGYNDPNGNWYQCSICPTKRNCVWWASYIRPDIPSSVNLGNANQWNEIIQNDKTTTGLFRVDGNPQVGAIAIFEAYYANGTYGIGSAGHAGYVLSYTSDTVTVSQMSCGGNGGPYNSTYTIYPGQISFIHAYPTLFEHLSFTGKWSHYSQSDDNIAVDRFQYPANTTNPIIGDQATSFWQPYGYNTALYQDPGFSSPVNRNSIDGLNNGSDLDRRYEDLRNQFFTNGVALNDQISAIKVAPFSVGQGTSRPQMFIDAYNRNGGPATMGAPTSAAHWWGPESDSRRLVIQDFEWTSNFGSKAIIHDEVADQPANSIPAFVVHGGIWGKYISLGGWESWLGAPTSDEYTNLSGRPQSSFESGYIDWINSGTATKWYSGTSGWSTYYFNNMNLLGGPTYVRSESTTNTNWGAGAPEGGKLGVFVNRFSVRQSQSIKFNAGCYQFKTISDDGVRLYIYVNGVKKTLIDQWHDGGNLTYTAKINLPTNYHTVQLLYFENGGNANKSLTWATSTGCP